MKYYWLITLDMQKWFGKIRNSLAKNGNRFMLNFYMLIKIINEISDWKGWGLYNTQKKMNMNLDRILHTLQCQCHVCQVYENEKLIYVREYVNNFNSYLGSTVYVMM